MAALLPALALAVLGLTKMSKLHDKFLYYGLSCEASYPVHGQVLFISSFDFFIFVCAKIKHRK